MAKVPAVTGYKISEKRFGGYIIAYQCPHCGCELTSQESEVGQTEQCPTCGNGFGVTKKALFAINQAKTEKLKVQAAKEKEKRRKKVQQEVQKAERELAKPKCAVCGSTGKFLSPIRTLQDIPYCPTHLDEKLWEQQQAERKVEDEATQRENQETKQHQSRQMVDCPTCNHACAPNAQTCPECGHTFVDPTEAMKRLTVSVAWLAAAIATIWFFSQM